MAEAEPVVRSIEAVTHGRVLIRPAAAQPPGSAARRPLLVGFHGYGENAERHLGQLHRISGVETWTLAAVQGLHRFYGGRMEDWDDSHPLPVVASWMTRQDREQAIADNVAYVDRALETIGRECPFDRLVFAGFSQGVAMAFRAAVLGAVRPEAVIALGGDVPPDVRDLPAARFPRVLIGQGTRDRWYTEDRLKADVALLESKGVQVQAIVFAGGHEWTDEFRAAAAQFLRSAKGV